MTNLGKKVIYQIYPKSFYDSNGDGIGDLRGIINKIDYIKKLNIDMIWMNPFFVSPQNDNGYDVADYCKIDPLFGTMADFEELAKKLKDIGVDIMLDMVLNHCSTEHPWFKKAKAGDKKYQKYFYIRPAKPDGSAPNNWQSIFGGSAWAKFDDNNYYLHLFDPSQADLDWHNSDVRKELANVINFWRSKGVHGFRFDVINAIGKDKELLDSTPEHSQYDLVFDKPVVHSYLKELNENSFGQDADSVTVGEIGGESSIDNYVHYSNPDEHELSMVFTFQHLDVDCKNGDKWQNIPFDFMRLKKVLNNIEVQLSQRNGWNAVFWNNHDQPWALSRFGDPVHYREKSAEMLAATIHFMRGTPYIYMGEEIGMVNPSYDNIADYNDVESKNAYKMLLDQGKTSEEAMKIIKYRSRDNARTPMHWDSSKNAGFTTGTPWLGIKHQDKINVKDELDHGEIFNFYQKLIKLRKELDIISDGDYHPLLEDDPNVFAYVRELNGQKLLVLNNFFGKDATIQVPKDLQKDGKVLLSNYDCQLNKLGDSLKLEPYQTVAFLE